MGPRHILSALYVESLNATVGNPLYVDYDNVPIETIDSLGLERLDLIKIDAQGFEAKTFNKNGR